MIKNIKTYIKIECPMEDCAGFIMASVTAFHSNVIDYEGECGGCGFKPDNITFLEEE